ncbi:MAG: hypothetical protein ACQEP7_00295 [bacterium]
MTKLTNRLKFIIGLFGGAIIAARFWFQSLLKLTAGEARIHYLASRPIKWIIARSSGGLNQPPLHLFLLNLWLKLTPPFSQLSRVGYGIIITFFALGIFYLWARLLFSPAYSAGLVLLLAWNPCYFLYSSGFKIYSLLLLFVIVAGYFATKIIVQQDHKLINWLGWTLASLGAIYTHSFALVYVALLAGLLVWEVRKSPRLSDCLLAIGSVLIFYLPWLLHTGQSKQPAGLESWIQSNLIADSFELLPQYFKNFFTPGQFQIVFIAVYFLIFVLLLSAALFVLLNWESSRVQLLVLAGVFPSLLTGLYIGISGGFFTGDFSISLRLLAPSFPFLILLFGLVLMQIGYKKTVVLFLVAGLFSAGLTVLVGLNYSNPSWKNLAEKISNVNQDNYKVVHVHTRSFYPVYYYDKQRMEQFHLNPDYRRGVDKKQLIKWSAREGLLIIAPVNYNIFRLNFALTKSPDLIHMFAGGPEKYRIIYFSND